MVAREAPGIIGDVSSLAANGLRAIRSSLELLTIELKEEKAWVLRYIVVALGAVYFISFGTLLAILAVSLAMPENTRPAVLGGFGASCSRPASARSSGSCRAKKRSPPFQDTIATLKRTSRASEAPPVSELETLRQAPRARAAFVRPPARDARARLGTIQANPVRLAWARWRTPWDARWCGAWERPPRVRLEGLPKRSARREGRGHSNHDSKGD
jgi:uncharacterized membrane protein YqjE